MEATQNLPLTSTFAESLAVHTALIEACKILDNPDADDLSKIMAENTINMIMNAMEAAEA